MKKVILFFALNLCLISITSAQTVEEMQDQKTAKEAELAPLKAQLNELTGKVGALEGEIATLTDLLTPYPRWSTGAFGTIGFNFANFNDWLSKETPNTSAATIGFTLNGFANLDQKKYFWRNAAALNLSWLKFDNKDIDTDNDKFQVAADAFNISSLFGYKLNDKWAVSALGEYRTAVLRDQFNNPGFLDFGLGATWTPIADLIVVIHPLNYNFVFSDEKFNYTSTLGAKIVADYTKKITKGVTWKSNFSTFISYEDPENFSNWTWTNTFTTAYKGIGIGFDLGLRGNKQEAFNILNDNPTITEVKDFTGDIPLQTFWILGLSYNL
jgi:hypothetical protein